MVRPRKNVVKDQNALLTPDNVVEIPVEEQPYLLPEGWKWVRLRDISEVVMGQSPSGGDTTDDSSYTPLIGGASDMGQLYPEVTKYTRHPTKLSNKNDIIVCIRATLGRPIFSDGEYCLGRGVAAIRSRKMSSQFIRFLFINFEQYLYDNATGTTFSQVNSDTLKKMPVPFPPIDEQQRIVDRVESLFAKLDEAREKAEAVLDGFESRKAAILHKAFTGELTAKWRNEKGIDKRTWKERDFSYVIKKIEAGKNIRCEERPPQKNEIGIVKVSAVTWGFFNENESKTCNDISLYNKSIQIKTGDFLFSRANTIQLVGNCVIVRDVNKRLMLSDKILRLTINDNIYNKYILYFSMSTMYRNQIVNLASGNQDGMRNISQKNLLKIRIMLPMKEEQQEIVRILDTLLEKERQVKEAAEEVLERIDLMKKSILAKAFRGELTR